MVVTLDAALGLHALGGTMFVLLGLTAVVSIGVGLRRHRPRLRWPWRAIGAAMVLWVLGGAAREATGSLGDLTATRSLVPDLITIPGYFLFAAGLWGIARARSHGRRGEAESVIDGVLAALAALVGAWVYLIEPSLQQEHSPVGVRVVLAAYPVLSIVIVGITVRIAFSPMARRTPAYRFLLTTNCLLLVGDVVYMFVESGTLELSRSLTDAPYALAFVAIAATLLHPSMRSLTAPATASEAAPSPGRLATITIALLVPVVVTLAPRTDGASGANGNVLAGLVVGLAFLAGVRVYGALRSHARAEARLIDQATHDALTGLPNRAYLREHVERTLRYSDTRGLALVFLDVDRFKLVNDTYGHSRGDELLVAVGARLSKAMRPEDLVTRIGGDEFVVILHNVSEAQALALAKGLQRTFELPFEIRGQQVHATASFGVAFADPSLPEDAESLIASADTAMYWAKDSGRDAVAAFDRTMRDEMAARLAMESALHEAISQDQLRLLYQPVVDIRTHRVTGLEALLRWDHPTLGVVSPLSFIPIAEDCGLIVPIGEWVIQEACRQLGGWRRTGLDLDVAVNVSARQLRDPALVQTIANALADEGLPSQALVMELTESALIDDPRTAADTLTAVRALGVRVSIDDFGTGYSSLSYLRQFPVDCVKIDRSFVEHLGEPGSQDDSLVAAILSMSDALGLQTIAEGIELESQESRLRELGCTTGQGFLFARPTDPALVPAAIAAIEQQAWRAVPQA